MNGKMKAVIYTRFSPRPDAGECDSCETQRKLCEEYARKHGWTVGAVYDDPDVSGADECRPTLISAVNALSVGDVLLVYRLDRIARNVYLFETIRRKIEQAKAQLVAVCGDVECADESIRTLVRQILAAVAEYERKCIARRTSDAIRSKMRDGWCMTSQPPYGWQRDPNDPKRMIPNETELATIDNIRLLAASGMGYGEIARRLDPATARKGIWHPMQIKRILERKD